MGLLVDQAIADFGVRRGADQARIEIGSECLQHVADIESAQRPRGAVQPGGLEAQLAHDEDPDDIACADRQQAAGHEGKPQLEQGAGFIQDRRGGQRFQTECDATTYHQVASSEAAATAISAATTPSLPNQ